VVHTASTSVLQELQVLIKTAIMEDHNGQLLDLSHAAPDIITMVLGSMSLRDRFNCALVCKAWAEAATAATPSIIVKHRVQDFSSLRDWLKKHGNRLEVLQLHQCNRAAVTALPCCAKLQDLLLSGAFGNFATIASRTWTDIASATKLTSLSVSCVQTTSHQADVVAALTALPNLEQLTWCYVCCSNELWLSDSSLLQQMTQLTSLDLECVIAEALQHLGSLTKLQHLSIVDVEGWAAAGCPGLQELKALTSLKLEYTDWDDLPASVSQLTALQQLDVPIASPTELNQLHVLTVLTQVCVWQVTGLSRESPPLKLPGLQHLSLQGKLRQVSIPMSFLASCTQLQFLRLQGFQFRGPGSLVASTMLQRLDLALCRLTAADGAADLVSWQQVFPGPGRLPHLTRLQLWTDQTALQQSDIEQLVECCSSLKVLHLDALHDSFAPAPARLPGLTNLRLFKASAADYGALGQLTGLQQLTVSHPYDLSAVGLRQLVALNQLTSLGFGYFCHSPDAMLNTLVSHLMKDDLRDCQDDLSACSYALINKVCVTDGGRMHKSSGVCVMYGYSGEGCILQRTRVWQAGGREHVRGWGGGLRWGWVKGGALQWWNGAHNFSKHQMLCHSHKNHSGCCMCT